MSSQNRDLVGEAAAAVAGLLPGLGPEVVGAEAEEELPRPSAEEVEEEVEEHRMMEEAAGVEEGALALGAVEGGAVR